MLEIQKTIVNKNGKRLIFDNILKKNFCYLTKLNGKIGALDSDGIQIIEPLYDEIIPTKYHFYIVKTNNLYGLINSLGKIVLSVRFTDITDYCEEEMVSVYIGKKIGFFNISSGNLIEPKYTYASNFYKGMAKVKKFEKYGFINKEGIEFIFVKYDWISEFHEGIAKTMIDNKFGYITYEGKELIETNYDEVTGFNYGFGFAKKENLIICIDKTGKEIFCLDPTVGIIRASTGFKKIPDKSYEEFIKFDCGLIVIKQFGRFSCISDQGSILVDF